MGRKLNALEEIQASNAMQEASRAKCAQQGLLERIAGTLGVTAAQLSEPSPVSGGGQAAVEIARQDSFALVQQCRELVRAFLEIQDPQDRLRCLEIVRAAADTKSAGSAR